MNAERLVAKIYSCLEQQIMKMILGVVLFIGIAISIQGCASYPAGYYGEYGVYSYPLLWFPILRVPTLWKLRLGQRL